MNHIKEIKKEIDSYDKILISSSLNKSEIDKLFNIESILFNDGAEIESFIKSYKRNNKIDKLFGNYNTQNDEITYLMIEIEKIINKKYYTLSSLYNNNCKLIYFNNIKITPNPRIAMYSIYEEVSLALEITKNEIRIIKNRNGENRTIKYEINN